MLGILPILVEIFDKCKVFISSRAKAFRANQLDSCYMKE